jgi:hypothetical protein
MKPKLLLICIIVLLLSTLVSGVAAYTLGYSLPWWTSDGGGGTSKGATYTLSGTIGQPDSGVLSGGNFTLMGGFWVGSRVAGGQFFLPLVNK